MENLLDSIAWNLVLSAILAFVVWCASRAGILRRRPALCHGLWLLVLLKLVTPPLVPVPLLPLPAIEQNRQDFAPPRFVPVTGGNSIPSAMMPTTGSVAIPQTPAVDQSDWPARQVEETSKTQRFGLRRAIHVLLMVSLLISVVLWLAAVRQIFQVRRLLRLKAAPAGRAAELLLEVVRRFDSRSTPDLRIADAKIGPLLWAGPGGSTILLPRPLVDSLGDDPLRCILAHEIAHLKRRDHWSNMLAFVVTTLFWWNPIAWFARSELAATAEACCDAMALQRLPGLQKSYAETLLAVVDFMATAKGLRPVLGIAFNQSRQLRRRFEMLASSNVTFRVSFVGWILLALGFAGLPLLPARAQEKSGDTAANETSAAAYQAAQRLLAGDRVKIAHRQVQAVQAAFAAGTVTLDLLLSAIDIQLDAELGVADTPKDVAAAHATHVALLRQIEKTIANLKNAAAPGGEHEKYRLVRSALQAAEIAAIRATAAAPAATKDVGELEKLANRLGGLLTERLESARQNLLATRAAFQADTVTLDLLLAAIDTQFDAELAAAKTLEEIAAAHKKRVTELMQVEDRISSLHEVGARGGENEKYWMTRSARQAAEIASIRAQEGLGTKPISAAPAPDPGNNPPRLFRTSAPPKAPPVEPTR